MAPERATKPAGVRAAGKARTHEKLLAAAAQVFADRGYGAASVEEIAKVADVSVGSVYTHFQSKQNLFVALMDRRRDTELAAAEKELADGLESAVHRLDERLISTADDDHMALLGAEAWLYAVRDPSFGEALAEHNAQLREDMLPLIAAERERRGATWSLSDAEVAQVALAFYTGLVQHRRLSREAVGEDLYGRALLALLNGLDRS